MLDASVSDGAVDDVDPAPFEPVAAGVVSADRAAPEPPKFGSFEWVNRVLGLSA